MRVLAAIMLVMWSGSGAFAQERGPVVTGAAGLSMVTGGGNQTPSLPSGESATGTLILGGGGYRLSKDWALAGEYSHLRLDSDHTYGGVGNCCGTLSRVHNVDTVSAVARVRVATWLTLVGGLGRVWNTVDEVDFHEDRFSTLRPLPPPT